MSSSAEYEGKLSNGGNEGSEESGGAGGKTSTAEERVERLLEYCNDKSWNDSMETFMNEHCAVFEGFERGHEHTLEQTSVYNKFLELFDEKLTDYSQKFSCSPWALWREAHGLHENFWL